MIAVLNSGRGEGQAARGPHEPHSGPCDKLHVHQRDFDSEISDNVFENAGGDCIHIGWLAAASSSCATGAPAPTTRTSARTAAGLHNDFIQVNAQRPPARISIYHGNVQMFGPTGMQNLPRQGIFSSKSHGTGWDYESNIICSNSYHGLTCGPTDQFSNIRARKNTVLRCIDAEGDQNIVQFSIGGAVEMNWNVQCGLSGNRGMGANGLNIVMRGTDFTRVARLLYRPLSRLELLRPQAGRGGADALGLLGRAAARRLRALPRRDRERGLPEDRPRRGGLEGLVRPEEPDHLVRPIGGARPAPPPPPWPGRSPLSAR